MAQLCDKDLSREEQCLTAQVWVTELHLFMPSKEQTPRFPYQALPAASTAHGGQSETGSGTGHCSSTEMLYLDTALSEQQNTQKL